MLRRRIRCCAAATAAVATGATTAASALQSSVRCIYAYKFGQVDLTQPFRGGAASGGGDSCGSGAAVPHTAVTSASSNSSSSSTALQSTSASTQPVAKSEVRVTRLHNGVRVITHDLGGPVVSVGAYVRAGPVYDPPNCPGVGAMMHLALTTSNYNNSLFQLDRNLRSVGAAESHYELYKHYIAIRLDARADKWRAQTQSAPYDTASLHSSASASSGGYGKRATAEAEEAMLKAEMSFARHPDPRVAAVQVRNRERYVRRKQEVARDRERELHEQQRRHLQQQQAPHFQLNLVQDNLFTCLAAPRFHETDIERFRDTIDNEVREMKWRSPAAYAVQMLETVAFYREPLGNPRFVPENNNGNISNTVLLEHYSKHVVPANIVIAGVNVDHSALIAEYENTPYPHSSRAPHHSKASAHNNSAGSSGSAAAVAAARHAADMDVAHEARQYTGGELVQQEERAKDMGTRPDMDTDTICALGWVTPGGRERRALPSYAASLVVRHLLDMALAHDMASSSSNLGCNAMLRYVCDEEYAGYGVRGFYTPYMTAGLLGFTVHCAPQHAVKLITDTARLLQEGTRTSSSLGGGGSTVCLVDAARLAAAKRRAALQYISDSTDSVRDYCDFLGTALPLDGSQTHPVDLDEVLAAIDRVSEADVARLREEMFSQPTSLFAHGEVLGLPSLRQMGL